MRTRPGVRLRASVGGRPGRPAAEQRARTTERVVQGRNAVAERFQSDKLHEFGWYTCNRIKKLALSTIKTLVADAPV